MKFSKSTFHLLQRIAMRLDHFPSTVEIKAVFAEEINSAGGVVTDIFDDGCRLFLRSVFPRLREVASGDKVQGGVALMAAESQVSVHPYIYRLVCKNGAIAAQAIQSSRIEGADFVSSEEVLGAVRAAIVHSSADEAFATTTRQMQVSRELDANIALNLLPHLARLSPRLSAQVLGPILDQFAQGIDHSQFGLMNAVTSVARDAKDPELRWRLEELGGGVCAGITPAPKPRGGVRRHVAHGPNARRRVASVR
jgi:hypothetical protein